jgi:hypothetical protein
MTLTKLEAIEKLRETRERSATAELESSNRARDLAGARAAHFEEHLQIQSESVRVQQTQLYEEITGRHVSSEDLDKMRSRVDSRNAELDLLAEQCGKAKNAAINAGAEADRARVKHAKVFRAQQKWAALMKRETEKSQKAESHREELTIEDTLHHPRTSR